MTRRLEKFSVLDQVCSSNPRPCRIYQDITFASPVTLCSLVFRNYYTYSITIKHRPARGPWVTLVGDLKLMRSPHFENDAQDWHAVEVSQVPVTNLRFYLNQPSPVWRHFGLKDIRCYSVSSGPGSPLKTGPHPGPVASEIAHRVLGILSLKGAGNSSQFQYQEDHQSDPPAEYKTKIVPIDTIEF
jgi:hypothetical protein